MNQRAFLKPDAFHPNSEDWGLAEYALEIRPCSPSRPTVTSAAPAKGTYGEFLFPFLLLWVGLQIAGDRVASLSMAIRRPLFRFYTLWQHRAGVVWKAFSTQQMTAWPELLRNFYSSAQARRK